MKEECLRPFRYKGKAPNRWDVLYVAGVLERVLFQEELPNDRALVATAEKGDLKIIGTKQLFRVPLCFVQELPVYPGDQLITKHPEICLMYATEMLAGKLATSFITASFTRCCWIDTPDNYSWPEETIVKTLDRFIVVPKNWMIYHSYEDAEKHRDPHEMVLSVAY